MYVCLYVCMYCCVYVCMHVCMHVCIYVCMSVHYRYGPPPLQLLKGLDAAPGSQDVTKSEAHAAQVSGPGCPNCRTGGTSPLAPPAARAQKKKRNCGSASCFAAPPINALARTKGTSARARCLPTPPARAASSSRSSPTKKRGSGDSGDKGSSSYITEGQKKGTEHRGGNGSTGCTCACD